MAEVVLSYISQTLLRTKENGEEEKEEEDSNFLEYFFFNIFFDFSHTIGSRNSPYL